MRDERDSVYVIIPAYNEEENIVKVIEQWCLVVEQHAGIDSKVVIINDGSKDNTLERAQELTKVFRSLVVLDKENQGHGATVLYGYEYALKNNPKYIFQTDSDGQTNPEEFLNFWYERDNYDVIIGHRKGRQDGFSRIIVTKTLKLVLFLIFHTYITDANTPFRLMKKEVLEDKIKKVPEGFFLSNVLLSVLFVKDKNINVKFKKITFAKRQGGVNSINIPKIIKIGFKSLKEFRDIRKTI